MQRCYCSQIIPNHLEVWKAIKEVAESVIGM